jgi:hypothetical protein
MSTLKGATLSGPAAALKPAVRMPIMTIQIV